MHPYRAHRVTLLVLLLLVTTSLTPFLQPLSSAQPIGQTRTLYFHEYDVEYFEGIADENLPTKTNDSYYPPKLALKNTSKLLPRYDFNTEEWITWFSTAWVSWYLQSEEFGNLTDLFGDYGDLSDLEDLLKGMFLLLPHPFRIVEMYEYLGDESANIDGDIQFDLYFSSKISSSNSSW